MNGYYTVSDLSRLIGITIACIQKRLKNGTYPKPTHKVGERMYYTIAEGDKIAKLALSAARHQERANKISEEIREMKLEGGAE